MNQHGEREQPGPPEALERFEQPLLRYALHLTGCFDAARDIVQETFARRVAVDRASAGGNPARMSAAAAAALPATPDGVPQEQSDAGPRAAPPPGRDHGAAWLYRVCRNLAIDRRRKEKRMRPLSLAAEPVTAASPADAAEAGDAASAALRLLTELPENQQEVVRLKFQAGLSYREIAEATELSVSNVGFLLHTALRTIRARMDAVPPAIGGRDGRPGTACDAFANPGRGGRAAGHGRVS